MHLRPWLILSCLLASCALPQRQTATPTTVTEEKPIKSLPYSPSLDLAVQFHRVAELGERHVVPGNGGGTPGVACGPSIPPCCCIICCAIAMPTAISGANPPALLPPGCAIP